MMMLGLVFCLYGKRAGGQSGCDEDGECDLGLFHEQKLPWGNIRGVCNQVGTAGFQQPLVRRHGSSRRPPVSASGVKPPPRPILEAIRVAALELTLNCRFFPKGLPVDV